MQKKALQNIRDFSMEKTMSLEEKNQALIEQQDNEVLAATLKERNRIAREIHDNVGHMLTRSILQMGAIKVINKDKKLSPALEDLHSTLNLAMTNIRASVHDLHDESIDLEAALKDILENVGKFTTNLDYDVHDQIPRNIKYAFIAITKEAVNNAVKHSNGNNITVIVNDQPGFYKLLIKDNGSVKKINVNNGIGLSNMRDRANSINGIFKMTTQNGVTVMVTVMK